MTDFRVIGIEPMRKTLQALGNASPKFVAIALYREAERIMTAAKRLTPVLTGNLRGSGHVQLPEIRGGRVTVRMGFGGPSGIGNVGGETNDEVVNYAIVIHEDLQLRHTNGQAKYLEQPVDEAMRDMDDRLAVIVRDEIERAERAARR